MKTLYDVISCIVFAGIALLFLQRSAAATKDEIPLWRYAVAALGCATGDVAGNNGYHVLGAVLLVATATFGLLALKVLRIRRRKT